MIIAVDACAKINWMLRVLGKRQDGFHDIETIFQTISLSDSLTIQRAERFSFSCSDASLPHDQRNLVVRAARAASEAFDLPPVAIELTKRIPAGAGLGGGSSDAAATLRGLQQLFEIYDEEKLEALAPALGSDVPFFLVGGMAYATGRGEELKPLIITGEVPLLLACSSEQVSTADAYRWLDKAGHRSLPTGFDRAASIAADLRASASELVNDFESVVFAKLPMLRELKGVMKSAGAWWSGMTGSGSAIVGAFSDVPSRDRAAGELGRRVRVIAAETRNCA